LGGNSRNRKGRVAVEAPEGKDALKRECKTTKIGKRVSRITVGSGGARAEGGGEPHDGKKKLENGGD